jgi:hypothetical protein
MRTAIASARAREKFMKQKLTMLTIVSKFGGGVGLTTAFFG